MIAWLKERHELRQLKRQKKIVQAHCKHEFHSIGETHCYDMMGDFDHKEVHGYCPACELRKVFNSYDFHRELNAQKLRDEYGGK